MNTKKTLALLVGTLILNGCTHTPMNGITVNSETQQSLIHSLENLAKQRRQFPEDVGLKSQEQHEINQLVTLFTRQADEAIRNNNYPKAEKIWRNILRYQPGNTRARQGLYRGNSWHSLDTLYRQAAMLADSDPNAALQKIQQVLEEDPGWPQAPALRDRLLRQIADGNIPSIALAQELRKPISINFHSHSLIQIFNTISQMTGVNFIFDNEVSQNATASIIATNTTAEDTINLLLVSNKLRKKLLNRNTLMIYPASPAKDKIYQEIEVKTFFLGYIKAKDANVAIRNLLKIREMHVDERTNTITIRAPGKLINIVERLLMTLDRTEAEVTLDVEVLEVNTSDIEKLGIQYPTSVGVGFSSPESSDNNIPINSYNNNNLFINIGDNKGISIDISKVRSHAKVLANPRIRVKNNKKAQIEIGEKIPVITSTFNDNFSSENVSYQDVGLKLEVTPDISLEGEIGMDVNFTLSSLGLPQTASNGLKYYGTNNRMAKTVLSSKDGETQMLAGLISQDSKEDENGIPWLSDIPFIGGLFRTSQQNVKRTEVILLITPHIDRSIVLPGSHINTISIGTDDLPGGNNIILRSTDRVRLNETAPLPPLMPPSDSASQHMELPLPNQVLSDRKEQSE